MMIKLLTWGTGLAGAILTALATIIFGWFIFSALATKMLNRELHGKKRPVMVSNDSFKHGHTHHR